MDRNVKIALGCGGAGCLGLIVVIVAGIAIYMLRAPSSSTSNRNSNTNANRNSRPDSPGTNDNSASNDNDSSSSSSLSDDEQHRLFHAASVTSDREVIRRVSKKLGLLNSDNTPNEKNVDFATAHVGWVFRNTDFVQEIDTPAKGRAYVDKHIND
jgi:hypothetical protein